MISQLRGEVIAKNERTVTLNVGGVGLRVYVIAGTLTKVKLNTPLTLHTHLAVREDALDLFGFITPLELNYFQLLLTVPGIGPKSALAVLALASPEVLRKAITAEDTVYLTRISGIGRKSAEKIVLALKDKLVPATGESTPTETGHLETEAEALEALKSLGYTGAEAREAFKKIAAEKRGVGTSELVKLALQTFNDQ